MANKKSIHGGVKNKILEIFRFGYFELLEDIISWLVIGIIAGACIDYFLPVDVFANFNGTVAKLIILFAGIPMYVCASATTPIAAALVLKGLSPGAALLFLLVGPATNISNINAVNSNASNINAVVGNETNINAVNSNSTNINTVAGAITNVNNVGGGRHCLVITVRPEINFPSLHGRIHPRVRFIRHLRNKIS